MSFQIVFLGGLLSLISVVSPGSASAAELKAKIQEYRLPTPQSRPHDPATAPDGSLWYTGQTANKLGQIRSHDRRY